MTCHIIAGGAGFVGVNLARRLLARGDEVVVIDNLLRGRREYLAPFQGLRSFRFALADCCDAEALMPIFEAVRGQFVEVWHLAANSDIPAGIVDPRVDLEQTFMTTFCLLEAMRRTGCRKLHFASSSAIYGDLGEREIHEDIGPLEPISNYGAMKLASEAQIRAAAEASNLEADIFRFPNVIGTPATHGVILDFVRKLHATPDELEVLGDGSQQKAYLHVDDLVDAMTHIASLKGKWKVFNIGPRDDGITVRLIAEAVRDEVSSSAVIRYGQSSRGWVGDVPRFRYSTAKLAATGWQPSVGSSAAVSRAVKEIANQEMLRGKTA